MSNSMRLARLRWAALAGLCLASPTMAAIYTWDANGDASGNGGSGDWNTTSQTWRDADTNLVAWDNAAGHDAIFPSVAGTVTVTENVTVRTLDFTAGGYIINGPGIITLAAGTDPGRADTRISVGPGEIEVPASTTITINAPIAGSVGLFGDATNTSGTLILGGNNTYTGVTTVDVQRIRVTHNNALGAGNNSVADGTVVLNTRFLELDGSAGNLSVSEHIELQGTAALVNLAGNNVITGTVSMTGGSIANINVTAGRLTLNQGTNGLTNTSGKQLNINGPGTLAVHGQNPNWTGQFNLQSGTLLVNGERASAVFGTFPGIVSSGATLGGTGIIHTGTQALTTGITIQDGGILSPGDEGPGTFTIAGNLILNSGSILKFDLANSLVIGGGVNDLLEVPVEGSKQTLTLNGILDINPIDGVLAEGAYRLINYGGTLAGSGLTLGDVPDGYDFMIDTSTPGQVNPLVTVVPEPASLSLLALGALGLMRRRRS